MRTRIVSLSLFAVLASYAPAALATHPDHEGERGFELHVSLGYDGFAAATDRVFLPSTAYFSTGNALDAFSGGFGARVGVGYRMLPYLSAGLVAGVQVLGAAGQYTPSEAALGARDSFVGYNVGAYARFYVGSFVNGARTNPRVFFNGWGDRRRFDPYVSLGLAFQGLQRSRADTDAQSLTAWTTTYVALPIVVGAEYRVLEALAVGIDVGVTPLFAGQTTQVSQLHVLSPGMDYINHASTDATPAAAANACVWLGVSARYTLGF